ncbi:MAG: hypothetical protein H7Y86_15010 [Rhizobacter sp.]|nr:hypothetical protein [Ferruginibacter sp.]
MGKRILILFFIMNCAAVLQAQSNDYDTVTVEAPIEEVTSAERYEEEIEMPPDTNLVKHLINIEKDSIDSWRRKKAFAYMSNIDSLLKASQETKSQPRVNTRGPQGVSFMSRLLGGPVVKIILICLAVFFVGIIIYQLLKSKGIFQASSASKVSATPQEEDELLLQNDFDQLVQQAYKLGDYRMAVRYLFLKTLQQLRDKNQINYEPDKTNSRYVYELPANWRNEFSRLIFQYEYVWYGHFDIDIKQYELVQNGFHTFLQKV